MPAKIIYALLFFGFFIHACGQRPLIAKNYSHELEAKNNLIVFVGKKMSFQQLPHEEGSLDNGFKATYNILQRVYGNYPADTITFEAYDHYGIPVFEQYEHVLLYVVEEDGKFYHEKYQFSPVYLTTDKRWAGAYSSDYDDRDSLIAKPEKIPFLKAVTYPTSAYFFNGMITCAEKYFPSPYYKIERDTAFAVYGNYVEQLFQIKKEGVLTARGLFGDTLIVDPPVEVQEVELEEISKPVNIKKSKQFIAFSNLFIKKLTLADTGFLTLHLLDTVKICSRNVTREAFIQHKKERIWDKRFIGEVIPAGNTTYQTYKIGENSEDAEIKDKAIRGRVMQILLTSKSRDLISYSISLNFIETAQGYKLFRIEDEGNRACSGQEYDPHLDFT